MKNVLVVVFLTVVIAACAGRQEDKFESFDEAQAIAASEQIISDFQSVLKKELVAAMADGGPENAVSVCYSRAPMVADSFSLMAGVDIRRVSLRQRNRLFSPDNFEKVILERFLSRGSTEPQAYSEIVFDSADVKRFRYMKEIKIGQLCLKCHGKPDTFSEGLRAVLGGKYPNDSAVGYSTGDSRGAFSITLRYPEAEETIASLLTERNK